MHPDPRNGWRSRLVPPEWIVGKIKPGMHLFLGTAAAEPTTLLRALMTSPSSNLEDIELVQVFGIGEAVDLNTLRSRNFRLKSFFSSGVVRAAVEEGLADLVPSRVSWIPRLIGSGQLPIDVAIVQTTPPNSAGYVSLGPAVDVSAEAIERAAMAVAEINPLLPRTLGDTFIPVSEFNHLVLSQDAPLALDRFPVDDLDRVLAANVASLIADGSTLGLSLGPLYDALEAPLSQKRHLGIHSLIFSDTMRSLVECGAVTNRRKNTYRGKALASYAIGSRQMLAWLHNNPLVEFQRFDKVFRPATIGINPKATVVIAVHKIDLYGRVGLFSDPAALLNGPLEIMDWINGVEGSEGGRVIFALRSRGPDGEANILTSVARCPSRFDLYGAVNWVVTEYGVVQLKGCSLRERAQALIDIAHPDDRPGLIEAARSRKILYPDQIFLPDSARLYPGHIDLAVTFKNGVTVRFRPIKPSDEEDMRRLFYRFSDESIYYRYFHTVRSMPHAKMQAYVNVNWRQVMSIVGLVETGDQSRIVAEGRYERIPQTGFAEVVFVVDEAYQSLGIASCLFKMLQQLAQKQGIKGFVADVLFSNMAMMKVFRKGGLPVKAHLEAGVYHLSIPFAPDA